MVRSGEAGRRPRKWHSVGTTPDWFTVAPMSILQPKPHGGLHAACTSFYATVCIRLRRDLHDATAHFLLARPVCRFWPSCNRPGLARQATHQARLAVPAGRDAGVGRPPRVRCRVEGDRPDLPVREPRRRRRHDRHGHRRARRSRRLYAAGQFIRSHHNADHLSEHQVRRVEGSRAGHPVGAVPQRSGRADVALQDHQGDGRLRPRQPRQAHVRLGRHRRGDASQRRAAGAERRLQGGACAVSRRARRPARDRRRPHRLLFLAARHRPAR